jgi:hypothetical protein
VRCAARPSALSEADALARARPCASRVSSRAAPCFRRRFRIFLCEEGSPASEIERCELTEADAPPPDLALDAFVVDYEDAP